MLNISILSRRAERYHQLLIAKPGCRYSIKHVETHTLTEQQCAETQALLADPDLAAKVIDNCPNLKWLQSTWAGVEALSTHPRQNYQLTGVKDVFGKRMREYVMAHLLEDARKIREFAQLKSDAVWSPARVNYLYGKTIGILGLGNIGMEVAKLAKAFDMRVLGLARQAKSCEHIDLCFSSSQKQAFASQLDYLVALLPQTVATNKLIDAQFLSWLPKHCLLINAGRGNVMDENALYQALNEKRIRAAVLDVFVQEPLPPNHPFWSCPNLLLTQHTAAITNTREVATIFLRNLEKFVSNQPLEYLIDFEAGY